VADAIRGLASRLGSVERALAELGGPAADTHSPGGEVRELRQVRGQNPAGG
jgi:hypothetical protein